VAETLADISFDGVVKCAHVLNHLALAHHLLNSHRREFIPGPFLRGIVAAAGITVGSVLPGGIEERSSRRLPARWKRARWLTAREPRFGLRGR
jgi:hypothetical protein